MLTNILTSLTLLALLWYTVETRRMRIAAEQQHRREWNTDYYFAVERYDNPSKTDLIRYYHPVRVRQADAVATLANLGRPAILVLGIWLRTIARSGAVSPVGEFKIVPIALSSGSTTQFIVADFIVRALIDVAEIPSKTPEAQQQWDGTVEIGALVYSEGTTQLGSGNVYDVQIAFGAVASLCESNRVIVAQSASA